VKTANIIPNMIQFGICKKLHGRNGLYKGIGYRKDRPCKILHIPSKLVGFILGATILL